MTLGTETGEVCNRDGCKGVIEEHPQSKPCSCHIHPPCSACVDDRHYCPECLWEGIDEQKIKPSVSPSQAFYNKMMDRTDAYRASVEAKIKGTEPIEKLEYISESHTHFSMIKRGVYPPDMTTDELLAQIKGTFGGRFESLGRGRFKYIAYTD